MTSHFPKKYFIIGVSMTFFSPRALCLVQAFVLLCADTCYCDVISSRVFIVMISILNSVSISLRKSSDETSLLCIFFFIITPYFTNFIIVIYSFNGVGNTIKIFLSIII